MRDTITLSVLCIMFIAILTFIIPSETCKAVELTVGPGSGYDYNSIQSAINAANESDNIYVSSGTYNENIIIDKSISLISTNGASNTIINSNSDSQYTIKITAENVVISGFKVQNILGKSKEFGCIWLDFTTGCQISNSIIREGKTGIYLISSSYNTINGNTVEDNNANGITLSVQSNNNQIIDNIIQNNGDKGIQFTSSSSNTITGNTVSDNIAEGAYLTANSISNVFYDNIFSENWVNAEDCCNNEWDDGSEGNYWSDYNNYETSPLEPYNKNGVYDEYPLGYFLNQKPVAHISSISPNPATVGTTIQFSGYGTDDGNIVEWEWKINSDIVSGSEDFTYSSLSTGTYSVYFRVKDNEDKWSDYTQQTLVVNSGGSPSINKKPTAYIMGVSPSTAYFGDTISFSGYGIDEDGTITNYNWSSSIDGYLPESSSFKVNSLSVGTHNIAFKVRDNQYLWSNPTYATLTIEQITTADNQDPVAITNKLTSGHVNDEISFDASESYDNDGSIAKYKWDFGDGTTSSSKTTAHSYTQEGEYAVVLTVTDNYGAQDTETTTVTIISNTGGQPDDNNNTVDDTSDEKWVIPGFETITFLIVIIAAILIKKKRK